MPLLFFFLLLVVSVLLLRICESLFMNLLFFLIRCVYWFIGLFEAIVKDRGRETLRERVCDWFTPQIAA